MTACRPGVVRRAWTIVDMKTEWGSIFPFQRQ